MERLDNFDILKGIAMLFVIWGHISTIGFNFIYSFHMPVFFIISGYFFRQREITELLKNGMRRLIVPYFFTCIIAVVIRLILGYKIFGFILTALWGNGSSMNTAKYFSDFPNIGPIWFLLGLFWCMVAFHYIMKIKNQVWVIALISAIFLFSTIIGRSIFIAPFSLLSGLCALPFMYFGYYSRNHDIKKSVEIPLLATWGGVIFLSHMNIARCYFECYFVDILGGIGGYLFFLFLSSYLQNVKIVASALSFIGRNSLVYLCFHYIINVYFHFNINDFLFFLLQIIALTVIVVLLSFSKTTKNIFKINLKLQE